MIPGHQNILTTIFWSMKQVLCNLQMYFELKHLKILLTTSYRVFLKPDIIAPCLWNLYATRLRIAYTKTATIYLITTNLAIAASIFHNSLKYKFFSYLLLYFLNGQVKKIISKSVNNDQHLSTVMHSPIFLYGLHDGSKRCHVCIILKTTAPYKGNADCANEWVNHGQA